MNNPHVIRLRHPWSTESVTDGPVVRRRRFNRPTGLSEREQVWLVLSMADALPVEAIAGVVVNSSRLDLAAGAAGEDEGDRLAWNVTTCLGDYNEIKIEVEGDAAAAAAAIEESVAIEIRLGPVGDF